MAMTKEKLREAPLDYARFANDQTYHHQQAEPPTVDTTPRHEHDRGFWLLIKFLAIVTIGTYVAAITGIMDQSRVVATLSLLAATGLYGAVMIPITKALLYYLK